MIKKISDSEMASPLVLVKKPDNSIRVAVDYRELNALIKPTANQLPYQQLLFSKLSHQKYFAKVDNLSGYYQLKLTERAKKYCAINTPWGLYSMEMLGFGISTAPEIYQQRMVTILGDLYLEGVVVYIDDTLIYGATVDEFLDRLDKALSRMVDANVRLKPSKCSFGVTEILFLGHEFNCQGYKLSEDRKLSISNVVVPHTMTQLRSFLGMVNFFRNFIPNLSSVIAPLTDLTRDTECRSLAWTTESQVAFDAIKEAISNSLTLHWMNEVDPIILYTDASLLGLAMLVQDQKGEEVPLMFVSKTITPTQRNWSTIEQRSIRNLLFNFTTSIFLIGSTFFCKNRSPKFGLFICQYSFKSHSLAISVIEISVHCCPYPGRFKCSGRYHLSFFCS